MWFIWTARNNSKHRHIMLRPVAIIRNIRYYIATACTTDLIKAEHWKGWSSLAQDFHVRVGGCVRTLVSLITWSKPSAPWFKLNTDGCRSNQGLIATGGLIRDPGGCVQLAFHGFLGEGSIIKAELSAILQGLIICKQHQFFPVWIETESAVALLIINSDHSSWELRHILTRIKDIRANHPTFITHIHREGNAPADALASLGMQKQTYEEITCSTLDKRIAGLCKMDQLGCPNMRIDRKIINR
ncbi:hypothetical protein F511_38525 [Dorcoceras hygrometricum]|uniref:RNase H type-1 domain-containing protein n=1 Tax=Dorcoceras hygrometricum TaxID=472368 RepID=A0A2Z7DDN1_9LAMI|nr:hypothetical protein F511_38525 [Dorcoceras hygrometricum]